jgi:hypothetical protein
MNDSIKVENDPLLKKNYQEIKEHLFARVLLERSEEVDNLSWEELQAKIIANFGVAAMAILEDLMQETDLSYFNEYNDIKSLFELSNHAKLCYSDHAIRRRLISELGYKFFCTKLKGNNPAEVNLELLAYVADAIAFLAKNKIQFVEDFGSLFNVLATFDGSDPDFGSVKYDLGKRLRKILGSPAATSNHSSSETLRVCDFSAALQEVAYQDLTVGSDQATIPGWKNVGLTGFAFEVGEKAYWDIFFWLRPGIWLRENLQQTTLLL